MMLWNITSADLKTDVKQLVTKKTDDCIISKNIQSTFKTLNTM